MTDCPHCLGLGMPTGCHGCGAYTYTNEAEIEESEQADYRIPMYYKKNQWDEDKIKYDENKYSNAILTALNTLVTQTREGRKINNSYAIMLPYGKGKKTAMFSIIQNYIQNGYTVAPVIDVASLAIIENNFKANDKKATETFQELIDADLVCVYGVDFSARYHTMKLYINLCSMRGLRDRPTLLFAENSLKDLRSQYISDNLSEENNKKDIGCRLANPFIYDGVAKRRNLNG